MPYSYVVREDGNCARSYSVTLLACTTIVDMIGFRACVWCALSSLAMAVLRFFVTCRGAALMKLHALHI